MPTNDSRAPAVTKQMAEHVVATDYEDFGPELIATAKMIMLDGIANMLAGSRQPLAKILVDFAKAMGGTPTASIVGSSFKTNPSYAAFTNAAFCHSLDYEAMWWPPTHPTSPVLPALLALSEQEGICGKKIVEGFVVGFEVQGRLNLMIDWIKDPYAYHHPPGTIGAVGSAAACAKLLGLDVRQTRMAMGIAASRAGGLWANSGTMTKSQHSANAARAGVESALLVRAGYDADENVIEAKNGGFAKVFFGDEADVEMAIKNFGRPYRMMESPITIKKHPAQTTTHWCIDAALEIKHKYGVNSRDVEAVRLEVGNPNWSAQWLRPRTGLDGKFSIHYTVALALIDGKIAIDSFTDQRRFSADMEEMLGRITVIQSDAIPGGMRWPETWATIAVTLKDGRVLRARCDKPRGRGDQPLTRDEHLAKVTDCSRLVLDSHQIRLMIELVERIDELGSAAELCECLRAEELQTA
jgi:2-methylcitrate dehydratase PrpD